MSGYSWMGAIGRCLFSAALAFGCGGSGGGNGGGGDGDGTPGGGGSGAGPVQPGAPELAGRSFIRLANLLPGEGRFDFCTAPQGSADFTGPLLENSLDDDGEPVLADGVRAVSFDGGGEAGWDVVSPYIEMTSGALDVRIVDGTATSCDAPLHELTGVGPVLGGTGATVALVPGPSSQEVTLRWYPDELGESDVARVRVVHASSSLAQVDFLLGAGASAETVFRDIPPLGHSTVLGSYGGYQGFAAISRRAALFSVLAEGSASSAWVGSGDLSQGTQTFFLVGRPGDASFPLRVLICPDRPFGERDGRCDVWGEDRSQEAEAFARFGNFLSYDDTEDAHYCFRTVGSEEWRQPTFGEGASYAYLTRYDPIAAGRVEFAVTLGDSSCTDPLLVSEPIEIGTGEKVSVYLNGTLDAPSILLTQDQFQYDSERVALRMIHFADATGALVGGVGQDSSFQSLFSGLSYGSVGAASGPGGYALIEPLEGGVVTVREEGSAQDLSRRDDMYMGRSETWTAFLLRGQKFNSEETEVQILLCHDSATALSWRTGCRDARGGL